MRMTPLTAVAACLWLAGCDRGEAPAAPADVACGFDAAAELALTAIAERDFNTLAHMAHPERGVRLSPYATVDLDNDRVMSAAELRTAGIDHASYRWGAHDGTGDAIELSCAEYFDRFVYSHDFREAPQRAVGRRLGTGNSIDNIAEAYPDGRFVEYHVPGVNPDYGGLDWGSLRLVFVEHTGCWKLVGIVHDQWTI